MNNPLKTWNQLNPEAKKLGFVSFFSDVASEMLYPITPLFLTSVIGAPPAVLGLIEGVAQATSSLLQWVSGRLSDRWSQRKPFVVIGYLLSALSKPAIGLSNHWTFVLLARASDRVGKGLRSSPRDAMLGDLSTPETRGITFGWHRGLDTLGAVLGPLVALALLPYFKDRLRWFYALSILPGLFSVMLANNIRESAPTQKLSKDSKSLQWIPWSHWSKNFRYYLITWGLFSFGNSTDFFLILKVKNSGISIEGTVLIYCFFNVIYSVLSPVLGDLSDRWGRRPMLISGLLIFSLVYAGFAVGTEPWHFVVLFGLYGAYNAATEGLSKASGLGLLSAIAGGTALVGGVAAGLAWNQLGASGPMQLGSAMALIAAFLMLVKDFSHSPSVHH
jgi:MFS family permease